MKRIIITGKQYDYLVNEGVSFTKSGNADRPINFSIDTKRDDLSNRDVDTRVFNTKNNLLYGDGSINTRGPRLTFGDKIARTNGALDFYRKAYAWIEGGCSQQFQYSKSYLADRFFDKWKEVQAQSSSPEKAKEVMLSWISATIGRYYEKSNLYQNKYNRTQNYADDEKVPLYNRGTVMGTNVEFIALFEMNDFNFSDAIKNGNMRQNGLTDDVLGIDKGSRESVQNVSGKGKLKRIPISYDDNITPDIAGNFSLGPDNMDDNGDHYKKSYALRDKNYTSVARFLDKSIMAANYALKDIGYHPDVIVSAPSSSEFNKYYCINLSRKLNVPYIQGFFDRNIINVEYDERTERELTAAGASASDKLTIKNALIKAKYGEIMTEVSVPIKRFINTYINVFSNIPLTFHGRDGKYMDINMVQSIITTDICDYILKNIDNNTMDRTSVYKSIVKSYIKDKDFKEFKAGMERNAETGAYEYTERKIQSANMKNRLRAEVIKKIKLYIGLKRFSVLISEIDAILLKHDKMLERGVRFNYDTSRFKITEIEKRFRGCIHNVYIISDKMLSKRGNELQAKYKNANFLIFDEDINSGATLKCLIDVLEDKIDNGDDKIKCLVNASSLGGR